MPPVFTNHFEDNMTSVQTTATVSSDGKLVLQLPPSIPPGEHRVVLVIDYGSSPHTSARLPKPPLALNVLKWKAWPANATFRREEIYEYDER